MEFLGIDIGGSGIKAAPVDTESGRLTADRARVPTPESGRPDAIIHVIGELVHHFDWTGPIGCAFPARIKEGIVQTATNVGGAFIGLDFGAAVSDAIGLPVSTLNDADAAGLAEMTFGAGRERRDLVLMLTIGTGIGTALFVNGTLVPNTELGHVDVGGKVGEDYASDRVRETRDLSWKKWAKRLQNYLDRIEFLLSPDLIILGGGVSRPDRAGEFMPLLKTEAELVPAQLANHAGIVGAALYAARRA